MKKFIANAIYNGCSQPMPILNKINDDRALYLCDYKLDEGNASSFANAITVLVPEKLKKLTLSQNTIPDKYLSELFVNLAMIQAGTLSNITIINNDMGDQTLIALAEYISTCPKIAQLKRLHLKNPTHKATLNFSKFFCCLAENKYKLTKLQRLTISQFNFDKNSTSLINLA